MQKAMTILRTLFLIFVVGFTGRGLTVFLTVARTFDEQYARCTASLSILERGAWLAIAWIALETAIGWWMVIRSRAAASQGKSAAPQGPAGA